MASTDAKMAAGTYVPDTSIALPSVLAWATYECRNGTLAKHVKRFCDAQQEILDQSVVIVENVNTDLLQCCITCRCFDHESDGTFVTDVRFVLEPKSGSCRRL